MNFEELLDKFPALYLDDVVQEIIEDYCNAKQGEAHPNKLDNYYTELSLYLACNHQLKHAIVDKEEVETARKRWFPE